MSKILKTKKNENEQIVLLTSAGLLAAVTTNILTIKPPAWQKELGGTHHSEFGFFYLLFFLCDPIHQNIGEEKKGKEQSEEFEVPTHTDERRNINSLLQQRVIYAAAPRLLSGRW